MAPSDLPLPPEDPGEILQEVGKSRAQIYHTVRDILNEMEEVARWQDLYYPPSENQDFVNLQRNLLDLIGSIPYRVWGLQVQIVDDALYRLIKALPETVIDEAQRQPILAMLGPEATSGVDAVTRMTAKSGVDSLPDSAVSEPAKKIMRWLIDRDVSSDGEQISMDDFDAAIASFPDEVLDAGMKEILDNIPFYFDNIHHMAAGDVEKLTAKLQIFEDPAQAEAQTAEERVFTCEVAADLKGKYSSAIMGAAANLVAEGRWNGSDLEPVLFPEKAQEFERNEQLVKTLQEVLESIKNVPQEVPLVDIVSTWDKGERVDRYALTHLYGFLGSVGKLMKESSRRALYSGDYHAIQQRESRLAARINEIAMLHNQTWAAPRDDDPSIQACYPQMVDKVIQLAAVLEVDILKRLIGQEMVSIILQIVSLEGERRRSGEANLDSTGAADYTVPESLALREKVPERMKPLISLLADEDLQTFLELLLGSVLKRTSFTVQRRREQAAQRASEAAAAEAAAAQGSAEASTPQAPATELPSPDDVEYAAAPDELQNFLFEDSVPETAVRPGGSEVQPPSDFAPSQVMPPDERPASQVVPPDERPASQVVPPDEPVQLLEVDPLDLEILPDPELKEPELKEPLGRPSLASDPDPDFGLATGGGLIDQVLDMDDTLDGEGPEDTFTLDSAIPVADENQEDKIRDLETFQELIRHYLSSENPNRKSFDLVHKMLSKKAMIPPAMLASIMPLIEDISENLAPQLAKISAHGSIPISFQAELNQYCRALSRRDVTPQNMKTEIYSSMEGLLRLLGDLEAEALNMLDHMRADSF